MGNAQSNDRLYHRLNEIVPTSETKKWEMFDKSTKPFSGTKDREQFIWATITVLTQNGALLLGEHQIRLLYSRRANNDRIVARLVAEKDGVITTKIEPAGDGRDQAEAFNALRRDVEVRLDRILCEVPGESPPPTAKGGTTLSMAGQAPAQERRESGAARRPMAAPPVQRGEQVESEADRIMINNEGPPAYGVAVKEWKSGDEKRG